MSQRRAPSPAPTSISGARALAARLGSLLLRGDPSGHGGPTDVAGVAEWFGAMQSQDLASGLWSFGARLPGWSMGDVVEALERREALRTWPMRGTVHFVPARDAHWMLDLMGQRPLAGAAARRAFLGLDEAVADRAVEVLRTALSGGGRLTRAQCIEAMESGGVTCAGQRAYHLLWYASQRGVTCIAPSVGSEQTFVLLDEWVPDPVRLGREEALATIALRYFRSHGPATRPDFAGWTGLTMADCRAAIALAGEALERIDVDGQEMYWAAGAHDAAEPEPEAGGIRALPGFDEYMLGYKDRSLMFDARHKQAIIPGGNGVFQATIVRAGRVVGTWKRSIGRERVVVSVQPLLRLSAADRRRVEAALEPYARFVGRELRVTWPGHPVSSGAAGGVRQR